MSKGVEFILWQVKPGFECRDDFISRSRARTLGDLGLYFSLASIPRLGGSCGAHLSFRPSCLIAVGFIGTGANLRKGVAKRRWGGGSSGKRAKSSGGAAAADWIPRLCEALASFVNTCD